MDPFEFFGFTVAPLVLTSMCPKWPTNRVALRKFSGTSLLTSPLILIVFVFIYIFTPLTLQKHQFIFVLLDSCVTFVSPFRSSFTRDLFAAFLRFYNFKFPYYSFLRLISLTLFLYYVQAKLISLLCSTVIIIIYYHWVWVLS